MAKVDKVTLKLNITSRNDGSQRTLFGVLLDLLLSMLAFFGFGGLFLMLFGITVNPAIVLLCVLISCIVLLIPTKSLYIRLIPAISAIVALVLLASKVANGFVFTANKIFDTVGCRFSKTMTHLSAIGQKGVTEKVATTAFLAIVAVLVTYSVVFSLKSKDIIIPALLSLSSIVACVVFCFSPPFWFITTACLYVLGAMLKRLSGDKVSAISLTACTILCLLITPIASFINADGYFHDVKSDIVSSVDNFRYGKSSVMPEGNFTLTKSFRHSGEKQLEIIMSKPDSLYLKGYVGEKYTPISWCSLDNEKRYQNAELFYWLHKEDFYGQNQISCALQALKSDEKTNGITVRNIGTSRKYIYYPYEIASTDSFDKASLIDGSLLAGGFSGKELYTINAYKNKVESYPEVLADIKKNADSPQVSDYLKNENHYRKFVYKSYLDIPSETRNLLKTQLGERSDKTQRLSYQKAQQSILSYLSKKVSYNENTTFSSDCGDFLQYFLEQSCEGYSVHYATAATLIFRYFGIPARYVEGYIVTPDDVKNAVGGSAVKIDDSHFHAWAEFYRDGVGWVPFEATPPYLNVMGQAQEISALPDAEATDSMDNDDSEADESSQQDERDSIRINASGAAYLIAFLVVAVVVLLGIIMLCVIRRLAILRRFMAFEKSDNKTSVLLVFSHTVRLLLLYGYMLSENELYDENSSLYQKLGDLSDKVKKSLGIYNKAKFSRHEISADDKQFVLKTFDCLLLDIKAKSGFIKNFYRRFIRCEYK